MFCMNCGTQLPDGSHFCSLCGTAFNNGAAQPPEGYSYQTQKNSVRKSEIQLLEKTIEYFAQKQGDFDRYDISGEKMVYNNYPRKRGLLGGGIALLGIGILVCYVSIKDIGYMGLLMPIIMFVVPGLLLLAAYIIFEIKRKKDFLYWRSEQARLANEIYNYYTEFSDCPVGREFINPRILQRIMGVLVSGRADTIKESLNILINDSGQARINRHLADLRQSADRIETQSTVAAIFAAASFFR